MQIKRLLKKFDNLHKKHGDSNLSAIYGCGEIKSPDVCFVFMNPTARNVSSKKNWQGIRAPWIGTKNVWKMFTDLNLFNDSLNKEIQLLNPQDWDHVFAQKVYKDVEKRGFYFTNLSKATYMDATNPTNKVFHDFLPLFKEEIALLNPKVIIAFGGQVSSVILGKNIKLSEERKMFSEIEVQDKRYKVFPVYYPVGLGRRNMDKAKDDIKYIMKNYLK